MGFTTHGVGRSWHAVSTRIATLLAGARAWIVKLSHREKGVTTAPRLRMVQLAFWAILVGGLGSYAYWYGDPRLGVATLDTHSYINSARASVLSWDIFSGRRTFTTNIFYKLISSRPDCTDIPISAPAVGQEAGRKLVPCFEPIVVLQAFLSITAWAWLALALAGHLKTATAKLLTGGIVALFAIAPQIAAWNSVLSSESLSLSLFAISLGLLVEMAFGLADDANPVNGRFKLLCVVWLIFFALWVFVRDSNLIGIPVTLVLFVPAALSRKPGLRRVVVALAAVLIVLFAVGSVTARQYVRWVTSVQETLQDWIFPVPGRVEFLQHYFGMPAPTSAQYEAWFARTAPSAYMSFLLSHPGFVLTTLFDNRLVLYFSYVQPYYRLGDTNASLVLSEIGNLLHPGSPVFYLVDAIAVLSLWTAALSLRARERLGWTWSLTWLFLIAGSALLGSFFADSEGLMRHIAPYLEMFRLLMWLLLIVVMDSYGQAPAQQGIEATPLTTELRANP